MLETAAIVDRSYQLEEREDENECVSALYLRSDGTVAHGRTDGPQPDAVDGAWLYNEAEREIVVELCRHFKEGEVSFSVSRVMRGHLDVKDDDGYCLFSGNIYQDTKDIDTSKSAVGVFSMVEATDDLPDQHFDATSESA